MARVLFILFVIIFLNIVAGQKFRCDYRYNEDIDGWLKFHVIPATWYDARLRCHLEDVHCRVLVRLVEALSSTTQLAVIGIQPYSGGGFLVLGTHLASPLSDDLRDAIQNITFQENNRRDIFIGIHATFSKGDYFSIEGVPLSQIPINWDIDEPNNYMNEESCLYMTPEGTVGDVSCNETRPYVCYKKNEDEELMEECGTLDEEYVFSNRTGSCYKYHTVPRVYSRAAMACSAEGGYLSIINSKIEAIIIKYLFSLIPSPRFIGPYPADEAYLGFSDWDEHGEWLTSHGEPLKEAGYAKWSIEEVDNNNDNEYCGGVDRSGLLLNLNCDIPHTFFCEKNPISLTLCYIKKIN